MAKGRSSKATAAKAKVEVVEEVVDVANEVPVDVAEEEVVDEDVQSKACDGLKVVTKTAKAFHRCGRLFSLEPTVLAIGDLTPDEIVRLTSESMLRTEFVHL
jgi:hypothetical protein